MNLFEPLTRQEYLNLETFRKTGVGVKTPVWFVQEGSSLYVRTIANSGKVKRIRANRRAAVAPCKADGTLLGDWIAVQAREIKDPAAARRIDRLFDQKYGFRKKMFALVSWLSRRRQTFLALTPSEE